MAQTRCEAVDVGPTALRVSRAGSGPAVALLHGGPGTYDYLSGSVVGTWLAAGHEVVGYDQRGCGDSVSAGPFTVDANVADLEAVRRHLGAERIRLLGHSWGGLLALFYAAAFPRRVERLVLVGPAGPRPGWQQPFLAEIERRHTPEQRRRIGEIDARIARTRDGALRAQLYRQRFNAALGSYVAPAHRGREPQIASFSRLVNVQVMRDVHESRLANPEWERGLAALAAPVTLIHGRQDPMPWRVVNDIGLLLPHARVVPLENCGHFPWLEVPDRFRTVLLEALPPA